MAGEVTKSATNQMVSDAMGELKGLVLAKTGAFREYYYQQDREYAKGITDMWRGEAVVGKNTSITGRYVGIPDTYQSIEHVYSCYDRGFAGAVNRSRTVVQWLFDKEDNSKRTRAIEMMDGAIAEVLERQIMGANMWKLRIAQAESPEELNKVTTEIFDRTYANIGTIEELGQVFYKDRKMKDRMLEFENPHEYVYIVEMEKVRRMAEVLRKYG